LKKLREVLDEYLFERGYEKNIKKNLIFLYWKKVCGEIISSHVTPFKIKKDVLFVLVDHPSWGENFKLLFPEIKKRLNEMVGDEVIREVKIILKR